MAATAITNSVFKKEILEAVGATAAVGTDTSVDTYVGNSTPSQYALIDMTDVADERFLLVVENAHASAEKSVSLYPSDGYGNKGTFTASLAAGAITAMVIESAHYKQMSGTYKNKLIVGGSSTDIKVAAYKLP